MTKHLLSATDQKRRVVKVQKSITYTFNPKSNAREVNVSNITIYDKDFLNNYAVHKLNKKYKDLLYMIKQILENEDDESSDSRCNGLIDQYEDILENKYKHYLKIKNYQIFIDKIMLLRKYIAINKVEKEEEISYNTFGGR